VNALASEKVGDYLNDHFYSASQKVGTFRIVNGQKQGGNVASYFCTPDGDVIHAIPGQVKADTFLREARWAVEAHKLAQTHSRGDPGAYRQFVRKAHHDRLRTDHRVALFDGHPPRDGIGLPPTEQVLQLPTVAGLRNAGKVHALLAVYPLPELTDLYPLVWEKVLNERVSLAPVRVAGRN
jgi:hypothetical protein